MKTLSRAQPQWKATALASAIAAICANTVMMPAAWAVPACSGIISADQGQCAPANTAEIVINSGVTVSEVNSAAVYYSWNLGEDSSSSQLGSLTNNGAVASAGPGISNINENLNDNLIAGIRIDGELTGSVVNTGSISGASVGLASEPNQAQSSAYGIIESGSPAMQGSVVNSGTISASSTNEFGEAYASAIYIARDLAEGAIISNAVGGEITALANGSTDGSAFGIVIGLKLNGKIENAGLISGVVGGSGAGYSISAGSSDEGEDGEINNLATGTLRGILSTGSRIAINNAGIIDLSDAAGRSFVGGDFTQTETGTLKIMADSAGEDGYSTLYVVGTATIAGKAFVNVKEINTLAVGETLTNVVYASQLTGNFSQVDDNSALFNFISLSTEGEDGHIDLQLVKALTVVGAVNENRNFTSLGSATALDAIIDVGTTNANMQRVIDALGQLETSQQVSVAASQTQPQQNANTVQGARAALGGISKVIEARMDGNRGMSAGEEFYGDRKVWFKPFASKADQDNRGGVAGFDADTAGAVFGIDGTLSDRDRVGFALAYAQTNIDSSSATAPSSADVDMFQFIGYGSHSINASTELNYKLGVGQNRTDSQRSISFLNETAKAKYTSVVVSAGVGVAKTIQLNDKTSFTPSVRTDFTSVRNESYSETGSSANLNVGAQTNDELVFGIEGKVTHSFTPGLRVIANLGVGYDALNDVNSVTASFAAEPGFGFSTSGLDVSPWRQNAGLTLVHDATNGAELSVRVDTERSKGFSNNTLSAKVRYAF